MSIPISLCLFTSTKGHWGRRTDYEVTLNHWDRQIPLDDFAVKVAHLKVSPGDGEIAVTMERELVRRGFKVLTTTTEWSRGMSHQVAYMEDVVKMSKEPMLYRSPYILWLEDDSVAVCIKYPLRRLLAESVRLLEGNPDHLTVRLLRAGDLDTSPVLKHETGYFYSPHFNFQPAIMRSTTFYLGALVVERNWHLAATAQCEMLWRLVLAPMSRSNLCHIVWHPEVAHTVHLGCPQDDYAKALKQLDLAAP